MFVANYPLVDGDLTSLGVAGADPGAAAAVLRDAQHAGAAEPGPAELRPHSRYASLEQYTFERRKATAMFAGHRIPVLNSSAKPVEEMSTVILQQITTFPVNVERTSP